MSNANKNNYDKELDKYEQNAHSFLKYFGVFWGAIIIFIVQNYDQNSIAKNIADQSVTFFVYPRTLNSLGFGLLFIGVLLIIFSLILLMAAALGGANFTKNYSGEKKLHRMRDLLFSGVVSGLLGSIFLFGLFAISLMFSSSNKAIIANAEALGKIFFWIFFVLLLIIDPIMQLIHKKWYGFWSWANAVVALSLAVLFILFQYVTLPLYVLLFFIILFLIYFPIRIALSIWLVPFSIRVPLEKLFPILSEKDDS